ncbi:hypothetical protein DRE_04302 [Drechslerella stenobrocha 248]|uniref:Carrier domain-containing protein n=1 Tax=Drechslerella stenobrocha 248 TaxID=1043628 RepID=W7HSV4_9PEZI|nr:hypothetical protein DRE_04302 [Drechslerella stenobrocha 248]
MESDNSQAYGDGCYNRIGDGTLLPYEEIAKLQQFPSFPHADYLPSLDMHTQRLVSPIEESCYNKDMTLQVYLAWSIVLAAHGQNEHVVFGVFSPYNPGGIKPLLLGTQGTIVVSEALRYVGDQLELLSHLAEFHMPRPYDGNWFRTTVTFGHAKSACSSKTPTAIQLELTTSDCAMVSARFDPQLLNPDRMEWMISQLCHAIRQIQANHNIRISDIDLLAPEDICRLQEWGTPRPTGANACIHDLIERRAAACSESPAICAWDGSFTYRQLSEASSALARHLGDFGVLPGSYVPVLIDKSKWTAVAMLGILKAGGAFTLLEPGYPTERLQEIARALNATVVITSSSLAARAASLAFRTVVLGDPETAWLQTSERMSAIRVPVDVRPDSSAYVVFTSGSTGKPKGVVIHHSAYTSSALAHGKALGLSAASRLFQFASYAFDSSVADHLTVLLLGGCICVPSADRSRISPAEEYKALRANTLSITPSLARTWKPEDFGTVDNLLLGGEAPRPADVALWSPYTPVRNVYGPAECTPASTVMTIMGCASEVGLIGTPTGAICWIVAPGDSDQLSPLGLVGELLIEGPIVGRGYLNDPAKTAASFINCPQWLPRFRAESSRFYLTGDLVQYASNDSIRYVGRKDCQVKLRGQRIELGEVESHASALFAGTVTAEIIDPQDKARSPFLAVFIEDPTQHASDGLFLRPGPNWRLRVASARDALARRVPSCLIPTIFVPIFHTPLTPSGKTNRRHLREEAASMPWGVLCEYTGEGGGQIAPSTPMEKLLQEAWSQVLNIARTHIGLKDSLSRLGGDSLTAMQVTSLLRQRGIDISSTMLQGKSLGELAEAIVMPASMKTEQLSAASDMDAKQCAPFSLAPSQCIFFSTDGLGVNHLAETFILSPRTQVRATEVLYTIQAIVENHSMLRARFRPLKNGTSWTQEIQSPSSQCYRFQEYNVSSLDEFRNIASQSQCALDIENGPLLVTALVEWMDQQPL